MSIPPAYTYTSERLLREVYERASSQRRGSLKDANLIFPTPFGVSLNLGLDLTSGQPENVYRLAKFADSVLKTVPFSGAARGTYIRTVLPELRSYALPVTNMRTPVAWIYGICNDAKAGRTFVGLCGGVSNYRDANTELPSPGTEPQELWYPSSLEGLRQVFAMRAEDEEVEDVQGWEAADDPIIAAINLTLLAERDLIDIGPREVLAEVLVVGGPASLYQERYDTVILGAPLWIRHAEPEEDRTEDSPTPSLSVHTRGRSKHGSSQEPDLPARVKSGFTERTTNIGPRNIDAGSVTVGIAGFLVILGSLLPWQISLDSTGVTSDGGLSGDGRMTVLGGALILLITAMRLVWRDPPRIVRLLIVVCGVYTGLVGAANFWNVRQQASEMLASSNLGTTSAGPGLWVLIVGSILAMVGGTLNSTALVQSDSSSVRKASDH